MEGYVVVETTADGRRAFGPWLPSPDAPCLDCLRQRRGASDLEPGVFQLMALNPASAPTLGPTPLRGHQLPTDGSAERLVCTRPPGRPCPLDLHLIEPWTPDSVVGPRLGLIARVETAQWVAGHTTCVAWGAATRGSAGVPLRVTGTATLADEAAARHQAIWEALEHYAAGFWVERELRQARPTCARVLGAGPWVRARTLKGDEPVWVPAARVYMPFPDGRGGLTGHSEGLACGTTPHDARGRAVSELLERRALTRWWAGGWSPGVADPLGSPRIGSWEGVIARPAGQSVALCLHVSEEGAPYGWIGFGCEVDDERALAKARREAVHVRAHMRRLVAHRAVLIPGAPSSIDQQVLALAFEPGHARAMLGHLKAGQWSDAFDPIVSEASESMAWIDITPPDVQYLGLSVVRAVWLDALSPP